jgi:hypothetical protein
MTTKLEVPFTIKVYLTKAVVFQHFGGDEVYITEDKDRKKQTRTDLGPQKVVTAESLHAGDPLRGGNEERRRPGRPAAVNLRKYTDYTTLYPGHLTDVT